MKYKKGSTAIVIMLIVIIILAILLYITQKNKQSVLEDEIVNDYQIDGTDSQTSTEIQTITSNGDTNNNQHEISIVSNNNSLPSSDICSSTDSPSIKILSPNGGEVFSIGQVMNVEWESCNLEGNVFIEIFSPQTNAIPLVDSIEGTLNDGIQSIVLSESHKPTIVSGTYELRIFSGGLLDTSDETFAIFN